MSTPSKFTAQDWPDWAQPQALVLAIFTKMLVRYGSLWRSRVLGTDEMLLQRDWSMGLAGYRKGAIIWALENLPDDSPPLLGQFKAICGRAPEIAPPKIEAPAPKPDPQRVAAELGRMRAAMAKRHYLQWAYDLQEREARGERLTPGQRHCMLAALRSEAADETSSFGFACIERENLPPGMRA